MRKAAKVIATALEGEAEAWITPDSGDRLAQVAAEALEQAGLLAGPKLSRLLFEARESVEMLAEIVESRIPGQDIHNRRIIAEIDDFRVARGWNPDGFGGEHGP